MTMQSALAARLIADAGLTALVGSRIDWMTRPQAAGLPAITLQIISAPLDQTMKGVAELQEARVQADIWAGSYSAVEAVAQALIAAVLPPATIDGVTFCRASIERRPDGFEQSKPSNFYRASLDLMLWFKPA